MKRLIESNQEETTPTYGYPHVAMVIGSDHGAGKSRFLMKANLASSQERRQNKSINYGTRVFEFAEIKCKKDHAPILNLVLPDVNEMLEKLSNGMLVGVRDGCCLCSHKVKYFQCSGGCKGREYGLKMVTNQFGADQYLRYH